MKVAKDGSAGLGVDVVRARSLALDVLREVLALDSGEPSTGKDYSRAIALAYSLGRMWDGGGAAEEARRTWSLALVELLEEQTQTTDSHSLLRAISDYQAFLGVPPECRADYAP